MELTRKRTADVVAFVFLLLLIFVLLCCYHCIVAVVDFVFLSVLLMLFCCFCRVAVVFNKNCFGYSVVFFLLSFSSLYVFPVTLFLICRTIG